MIKYILVVLLLTQLSSSSLLNKQNKEIAKTVVQDLLNLGIKFFGKIELRNLAYEYHILNFKFENAFLEIDDIEDEPNNYNVEFVFEKVEFSLENRQNAGEIEDLQMPRLSFSYILYSNFDYLRINDLDTDGEYAQFDEFGLAIQHFINLLFVYQVRPVYDILKGNKTYDRQAYLQFLESYEINSKYGNMFDDKSVSIDVDKFLGRKSNAPPRIDQVITIEKEEDLEKLKNIQVGRVQQNGKADL
ncbi:hypothetical protein IMG5_003730 [Ichthyophthirius multifiliis]|uniref:Uncharacterized protein n=1 Tax=Ichthyophthirius multifiliis TaxID=5932 RepID=G0QJB2_ICHMU|nr:hypothetical protein IMG5_003730 [Ichthyophthirius multifiliis]EGR34693.1 hypothetical protein IMG5_003730 [Ichthyophthirius multifiliis]|eukprot:XP_004039997.1 hypothetical protein IMG5_003730 [Ichthyophthirius multifiliis]